MKIALIRMWIPWLKFTAPPLGLSYIAGALKKEKYTVKIFDAKLGQLSPEKLAKVIADFKPQLIGITVMSPEYAQALKLRKYLSAFLPDIPVMAGGPHITGLPEKAIADGLCDYAVIGQGEIAAVKIAKAVKNGELDKKIPNCLSLYDKNEISILDPDINHIYPDWNASDLRLYWNHFEKPYFHKGQRFIPLLTSRGCDAPCKYCAHSLGRKWIPRKPESIDKELIYLKKSFNIDDLLIYDDCFNIDENRSIEILKGIIRYMPDACISFPNGLMAGHITTKLCHWLKKANCYRVCLGIETGSYHIQKKYSKGISCEKISEAVKILNSFKIPAHGFFMLGFPDEDLTQMYKTIDFARSLSLSSADFSIVLPLPSTPIGHCSDGNYEKMHGDIPDQNIPCGLSSISLGKLRNYFFRLHYSNPISLCKAISSIPFSLSRYLRIVQAMGKRL